MFCIEKLHKRILMISDHSDPLAKIGGEEAGGQNVYVRELSNQLIKRGYEVDIFTRWSNPKAPQTEKSKSGFRVIRIQCGEAGPMPKEQIIDHVDEFISGIKKYITKKNHCYDVIHSHYWMSGVIGLELRKWLNIPLLHTFHSLGKVKHRSVGSDIRGAELREGEEKQIVEKADRIIATCPEERKQLMRLYKASPDKIIIIPVGVSRSRFYAHKKTVARRKVGCGPDDNVILFVGRLAPQKGLNFLLNALAILLNDLPVSEKEKTKLVIAGGSGNRKKMPAQEKKQFEVIQRLIKNLGLENNTQLAGRVPNRFLPWYYSAADICVVPSRYEPFGIVPLESMACGTPLVVSRVGGLQYTVQNLKTGFHARAKDMYDFAYKMRLMLENPKLRKEFGNNGAERIREEFAWEIIGDRIIKTYNSLLHQI